MQIHIAILWAGIQTIPIIDDQHTPTSIHIAFPFLHILVVRARRITGRILRVFPHILRAGDHTIILEIEIPLQTGHTRKLTRALETRGHTVQALLIIEQIGLFWARDIA